MYPDQSRLIKTLLPGHDMLFLTIRTGESQVSHLVRRLAVPWRSNETFAVTDRDFLVALMVSVQELFGSVRRSRPTIQFPFANISPIVHEKPLHYTMNLVLGVTGLSFVSLDTGFDLSA